MSSAKAKLSKMPYVGLPICCGIKYLNIAAKLKYFGIGILQMTLKI